MNKKLIPNYLTMTRICLVPIMIILSILKLYKIVLVLAIIGALTDMLDGKLARKWNVVSLKGAKLDDVADKTFAIGLLICLTSKFGKLSIILFLEIVIAALNYYYYKKTNKTETLMVGKFKTTLLFITIILYFISIISNKVLFINYGFRYATINLQFICLISYYLNYYKTVNKLVYPVVSDDTIIVENIDDLNKVIKKDN